ncbi:cell envelope integrity protein TolA [Thalassotalea mangrovi]|uniref:Cell envelope integrity protein TolA n=2 Tax=Thalassotalea mangrovi TaxID=2572245 RepID=A0A4U1B5X8_9GAMM|nr:cell envelope integrity protein TolA [Thalassotalea mangrovi]
MGIFTYLPEGKTPKQTYSIALSVALLLHIGLGAALLMNADFSPAPVATPKPIMPVIDAVVVDQSKLQQQVDKLEQQKAAAKEREDKRIKELERRAAEAQKKRQAEAERIKRLEQERQRKEVEKRKADDAAKTAKAKAAAEEKARRQKEEERKRAEKAAADAKAKRLKEEEAAKKAEQERKQREAEERRRKKEAAERAEQQRMLEQQMAEEMERRQQARSQQVLTEVQKYTALIVQTIERNFIMDENTMKNKSCDLKIKLASSGFVISVTPITGDQIVCQEAVKAVTKAGTLPVSKDPEVFKQMSEINLKYTPQF